MSSGSTMKKLLKLIATAQLLLAFANLTVSQQAAHAHSIAKETPCTDVLMCIAPSISHRSSVYFTPSYESKTSIALFEKGYYAEAVDWFENGEKRKGTWFSRGNDEPIELSYFPQFTLANAIAYEKLGDSDKALEILARGEAAQTALPHIRLLLKLGRCKEAERLCDVRLAQLNTGSTQYWQDIFLL